MKLLKTSAHIFRLIAAAIYLLIEWVWNLFRKLAHALLSLPIFKKAEASLRAWVATAPISLVLMLFLIPLGVRLAIKLIAIRLGVEHHYMWMVIVYISAEIFGFIFVAGVYDLCSKRLMELAWFRKLYGWIVRVMNWAHRLIDPYRQKLKHWSQDMKRWVESTYHHFFGG